VDTIYKIDGYPRVVPQREHIPEFLKELPWAVWRAEPRGNQPGKFNKAPCNPVTGHKVGANNPGSFGTYDQALAALESGRWSGFGVLLATGEIVGIDIDARSETLVQRPEIKRWLQGVKAAGGYCEHSPSGDGLRVFLRGKLPGSGRKADALEIYSQSRFLTVTGKHVKGFGDALIDGQDLIDGFLGCLPNEAPTPAVTVVKHHSTEAAQVDQVAKRVAEKYPELWAGDWQRVETDFGATGYPSQSEADMALCGHIARDGARRGIADGQLHDLVVSVFERSGLYRHAKRNQIAEYAAPKAVAQVLADKATAVEAASQVTQTPQGEELATHEPGDILAGKQFAKAMRGKLLWISAAGKWLRWDGTRWLWCECGEEMNAAKRVAGKVLEYASKLFASDPNRYRKLMTFATALQNLKRLLAMIELARSEDGMTVGSMSELDSNHWLLGVRNGVINLKDGGLLAADPAMLITRQIAAEFHSGAECRKWLDFLDQVFDGDQETIGFVQRALGYTLTGTVSEEALFICFGHGANGKSVFANVLGRIMADYARAAPPSLLTVRRDGDSGPRNDLAMLCGARLVSINETQSGDRLDEQVVKTLAGSEMISARFLHKEFFDFWPTAKPWLRTNHKPIVTGEDDGIWRRLKLIPFRRKFAEHERDPWLESKLLNERDGILGWMVQGCLDWQRIGLKPSTMVRMESASYRKESDLLGEFLEELTTTKPDARIEQAELFRAYRNWHDGNGTRPGSKTTFTKKLAERGYGTTKSNGLRFYTGLRLSVPMLM